MQETRDSTVMPQRLQAKRIAQKKFFELSFQALWRMSVLALPWQTRWFQDASLSGWPWEQGRISLYAGWIFILATVLCAQLAHKSRIFWRDSSRALVLLFAFTLLTTFSLPATAQWWAQVFILAVFAQTLFSAHIPWRTIAIWFVFSLLPHIAFGIWQHATQQIRAITWLGIAAQAPQHLGVSVIELSGAERVLRAYGGFPHPNIFGGWLAIGLITSLALARDAFSKSHAALWSLAAAAISATLFFTYARGAWIAASIGVVLIVTYALIQRKTSHTARSRSFVGLAVVSAILATGIVAFSERELLFSRLRSTERLEQKSLDVRRQSLRDGWRTFIEHPLFGTGPNAELRVMKTQEHENIQSREPLEPPHNAYLLALVDTGLVGICLLGLIAWVVIKKRISKCTMHNSFYALPLFILGLCDYYLWSFWSGQTLLALTFLLFSQEEV